MGEQVALLVDAALAERIALLGPAGRPAAHSPSSKAMVMPFSRTKLPYGPVTPTASVATIASRTTASAPPRVAALHDRFAQVHVGATDVVGVADLVGDGERPSQRGDRPPRSGPSTARSRPSVFRAWPSACAGTDLAGDRDGLLATAARSLPAGRGA